jgi:capsular polysaccharide biosynthesis protein
MFDTILSNFHIEKIFWILKVKLQYIIFVAVLFALAAGAYANYTSTSTYMAQISFYVYSNPDYITDPTVNINSSDFSQATKLVTSYMQILKSKTFLRKVQEETGLPYSVEYIRGSISSTPILDTAAFIVNVYNPVPENAMNIANAIGNLAPNEITRIVKSGGIEVLDQAELPTVPYQSTSVTKMAVIGGLGGFIFAVFWFLLRGLLDTTVRKKYEVNDLFKIPILGDVPRMISPSKKIPVNKILSQDSPFALREAYNGIRTNLRFTGRGEKCPIYAITSADSSEGKTLNTINLAVAFSQIDKKTLLIDADMRKSSMSPNLGFVNRTTSLMQTADTPGANCVRLVVC